MSIVRLCPYAKDEHCKYEIYYGEPLFSKCKNCEIKIVADMKQRKDVHKTFNNEVEKMTIQGVDMFEKEAEENGFGIGCTVNSTTSWCKGAEFGYNKANEWHYVKDGDLPKENENVLIYSNRANHIGFYRNGFWFTNSDGCLEDDDIEVIAWKEIVFPKGVGKCL